jgi:hypothetical protein
MGKSGRRVTGKGSESGPLYLKNHWTTSSLTSAARAQRNTGRVKRERRLGVEFTVVRTVKQALHIVKIN